GLHAIGEKDAAHVFGERIEARAAAAVRDHERHGVAALRPCIDERSRDALGAAASHRTDDEHDFHRWLLIVRQRARAGPRAAEPSRRTLRTPPATARWSSAARTCR